MSTAAPHIIALDLGTSGAKAIRFDALGRVVARSFSGYVPKTPEPGASELDPAEVLHGAMQALSGLEAGNQDALVLSSQLYAAMPIDGRDQPLGPILTWADCRASGPAQQLRRRSSGKRMQGITCCPPAAIYPVAKWRRWSDLGWPAGTARVVGVKEWVLHALTGEWAVDVSCASATGAFDLRRACWDAESLAWAGVDASWLAEPVPVRHLLKLTREAARKTGLRAGLSVVVGGGDGPLASLGSGAAQPGMAAVNAGTSAAVRAVTAMPAPDAAVDGLWTYILDGQTCVTGGIVVGAGSLLEWVRTLTCVASMAELGQMIERSRQGLSCQIRSAGPHAADWDDTPRFDLIGLRPGHGPGEIACAALHGVAEALAAILVQIERRQGLISAIRSGGSIGRSAAWLPALTRACDRRIEVPAGEDPSARGAALIGLAAIGAVADPFASSLHPEVITTMEPT